MIKLLPGIKNKWTSRAFNILYLVGWIAAIELGYKMWYFLGSTVLLLILFWKPLYKIMKHGGDLYASWCRKTADKTVNKFNPWKEHIEELKGDGAIAGSSQIENSPISQFDALREAESISNNKDKEDTQKEQES